jgi:hypothetical protein
MALSANELAGKYFGRSALSPASSTRPIQDPEIGRPKKRSRPGGISVRTDAPYTISVPEHGERGESPVR